MIVINVSYFGVVFDKVFPEDLNQNPGSATMNWVAWRKSHKCLDLNFYSIKKEVEADSAEVLASEKRAPDKSDNHLNLREVLQEGPQGSPLGRPAQGQLG